jgi:hypothetical protein
VQRAGGHALAAQLVHAVDDDGESFDLLEELTEADAERIAECVNACDGIKYPAEFVAAVRELVATRNTQEGLDGWIESVDSDKLNRLAAMLTKEADNGK